MTQVTILTGSAGAGKTDRLLDRYRIALAQAQSERRPGTTLWLAPTRRIQHVISQQITAKNGGVSFSSNVMTFDLFAEKILEAAGRPATAISPVMKRLLLRRITESLNDRGELQHFLPIAATTGFLDTVSNFISELKREEVWPDVFVAACQQRKSAFARRDLEVGLIYDLYQKHLEEQNWYDNEGRFWLARTALGAGVRGPFAGVQTLVVDGFADFTQTQYEILGHLSGWINDVSISLPVEHPITRTDLFSKPQAAISRIREHLPEDVLFRVQPVGSDLKGSSNSQKCSVRVWSNAIRIIADSLFSNPRFIRPSSDTSGLEIIAATGQFGEWEAVARRIKGLLSDNSKKNHQRNADSKSIDWIHPQDIVVGLRAITEDGPRLSRYLVSAGLPVWCEAGVPFESSPIIRSISSLLQLELEDWPFERLIAVLDSNFFQPDWPELDGGRATRAVAASLRRLRLQAGRDAMLRVLGRYASNSSSNSPARDDSLTSMARAALPLLTRLSRVLERLRRSHALSDWADVLAAIGDEIGWTKPIVADTTDGRTQLRQPNQDNLKVELQRKAELRHRIEVTEHFDLLQRILRTAAEADQKLSGKAKPRRLPLDEFAAEFRDLLSHETLKSPPEPGGSIRILGVEQIRNLEVPHLFLIGLTENSFPMSRSDDCLFSESERRDFIARGVALRHRSGHQADEMLLFYSVVTRARQTLTLSYPEVNSKGQPVFPSPYVKALESLFDPNGLVVSREGQLDPVPALDCAMTQTDLRLVAMTEARGGRSGLFRALLEVENLRRAASNTLAACEVAEHRFRQRGFTIYEGRLDLPQNLDGLRRRYGSHHQFSATELESYARCPFQFWLSTVLRVDSVESPEEGTDYAARGTLLHEVLANLLFEGALADPVILQNRFIELVDKLLDRHVPETQLQRALVGVERLILEEWADAFVSQQTEYDQRVGETISQIQSLPPEIPFGKLPEAPTDLANGHPAIQFGHGENAVNLRGRIDRVDVGSNEGHPAYVVIDYKTGRRPSLANEDLISGRSIQLALYLLAIKRLGLVGPEAIPYQMGFWSLRETGFKPGMGRAKFEPLDAAMIQSLEILLDDLLPRLAEGIRSGRFIVENDDKDCTGHCTFRTVCRVNQLRPLAESLGKRSPAPVDPTHDQTTGEGAFT